MISGLSNRMGRLAGFKLFQAAALILVCLYVVAALILSESPAAKIALLFIPALALYFAINIQKSLYLLILAIFLPFRIYLTAIPELSLGEVFIPFIFIILLVNLLAFPESWRKKVKIPAAVWLFFFLGLISYLRNPGLPTQLFSQTLATSNFRFYWNFFIGFMVYFSIRCLLTGEREKGINKILKTLFILQIVIIGIFLIMIQANISGIPLFPGLPWEVHKYGPGYIRAGFLGNAGQILFLLFLAGLIPAKRRWVKIVSLFLAVTALILSGGRGIILSVALPVIFYFFLKRKYLLGFGFILAWALALYFLILAPEEILTRVPVPFRRTFLLSDRVRHLGPENAYSSMSWRLEMWRDAWVLIKKNPIFGVGVQKLGYLRSLLPTQLMGILSGGAHNVYLGTMLVLGFPGFIAFIWIMGYHFRRAYLLFKNSREGLEHNFYLWLFLSLTAFSVEFFFARGPEDLWIFFFVLAMIDHGPGQEQ